MLESNLEAEGIFYLPPETTWVKEILCWETKEAQRAFGHCGWRFVISLQLTRVIFVQQAQLWSLTCKTHVLLNYEVIFLDYHAQLGKVCICCKEIRGGHQPREGKIRTLWKLCCSPAAFPITFYLFKKVCNPKIYGAWRNHVNRNLG